MKIATWNVNGIKARIDAARTWFKAASPDIALLQETKCVDDAFPRLEFEELGYNIAVHGQKGFNGVALLSKLPFDEVQPGLAGDKAVLHFVAWKQAAWGRFLMDELELGTKEASALWLRSFWKAMDRLFAGGVLRNCPEDYHWRG